MYVVYIRGTDPHLWIEGMLPSWSWDFPVKSCSPTASLWMVPGTY